MILRVFPRRTKATPTDELAFVGDPPLFRPKAKEVHISVAFTWDLPEARRLERAWGEYYSVVKVGGPATGMRGEEFVPGRYVKLGYVITSRGCPNQCWFCSVWKREGNIRELTVKNGWNVLDDNLLACSESHVRNVFEMLKWQDHPIEFTGGLEAKRLKDWHVDGLATLKPKQIFFAYDTPDDYEPLVIAGRKLLGAGFTTASHALRCYVLIGYPKDTFEQAETRLRDTMKAGFMPMAMLWRNEIGRTESEWRKFQRLWARPAIMAGKVI